MRKDDTLLIVALLAVAGYFLYKSGFLTNAGTAVSDKYTQYAQAAAGLANNATNNFLGVHNGISQGINDQINNSVQTGINAISNWAQMAQNNRNQNDQREADQFLNILNTI